MDKNLEVSPEEAKAEQEALAEAQEADIKSKLIEKLGLDEVDNADLIEKLVASEMEHKKSLSQAIGQKIKYRDELSKAPAPKVEAKVSTEDIDKSVGAKVQEILEQRDLDSLDYPEDLKATIKKVASSTGVSIKVATKDPYIQFKIEEYEKQVKADEATISRTNRSGGGKKYDFNSPPEVDMNTKEGREEYEKWTKEMVKQGH